MQRNQSIGCISFVRRKLSEDMCLLVQKFQLTQPLIYMVNNKIANERNKTNLDVLLNRSSVSSVGYSLIELRVKRINAAGGI